MHTVVVLVSNISRMDSGCFICVNISLVILVDISSFAMSGGILFKILGD